MIISAGITDRIKQALSNNNWRVIKEIISDSEQQKSKRAQKTFILEIYNSIIDTALKNNKPEYLTQFSHITDHNGDELFSRIIRQYIHTKDERWIHTFFSIAEKIDKKSTQSKIFALIAEDLISTGVAESDPVFIERGLTILDQINFRKYRSESMINIIPHLIVWAVTSRDENLLLQSLVLISDISDISKRSVLHAEIARAMSIIAIHKKDRSLYYQSITCATGIHQKLRRQECILSIIEKGAKSQFAKELSDIPVFIRNFKEIGTEEHREIISALTDQILEKIKDKIQIKKIIDATCEVIPLASDIIILDLLKKAEKSGDNWFLEYAFELQQFLPKEHEYPVREIIRAGIAVARHSPDLAVLTNLVPIIDRTCSLAESSRIYLQFSQIMIDSGDFYRAIEMFRKIQEINENSSQYMECLVQILKKGIFENCISYISEKILTPPGDPIAFAAINKAINDINKDIAFEEIINHLSSYNELILLHPRHDQIFLDSITVLINRGFLKSHDSDILVKLTKSIVDKSIKERAISNIVIKIAKIGVQTKNRDFLQRAVGITGLIDDQTISSTTMGTIIDEAAVLAASQGDLDLLLRMKSWSGSLLDPSLVAYAMANIVGGIIKYATDKKSPDSLEEAYRIAKEINDPSLKMQLSERIAESFIKIGCSRYPELSYQSRESKDTYNIQPFIRGLDIIKEEMKNSQVSLKIAGMIDIILLHSRQSTNPDYLLPLGIYVTEIENHFERDAMMSRVIANLNESLTYPDSADPYEIMTYLIQKNYHSTSNPTILDLEYRILNQISDPYIRLNGLCNLANSCIRLHNEDRTIKILTDVEDSIPALQTVLHKILILSDLTTLYSRIDPQKAKNYLGTGLKLLEIVEIENEAVARRHMVYAIVSMNAIQPSHLWIDEVMQVVDKITDPLEYINALIAAYGIIREDKVRCVAIIKKLSDAVQKIPSPYDKASILIEIIPLAVQCCNDETPQNLIGMVDEIVKKINITYIADTIHDDIARIYFMLYQKHTDSKYLDESIRILKTIEDAEIRVKRLQQMGYTETSENASAYLKINILYAKILNGGQQPNNLTALERLVRSVADRGKESIFFCDLAIRFRKDKEPKLAKKMMRNAISEAGIIRPLSHRAYVMCDIAMKTYAAGCDIVAQELIDHAMDAATNIRQSSMRDEVFNELGMAIKSMQEIR